MEHLKYMHGTHFTPRFPAILDYNGLEQDIVGRSTLEQILM